MAPVGSYEPYLPSDASNTLHVEGLPPNCTRQELAHIFRPFTGFCAVRLVNTGYNSRHVIAYADFETPAQAFSAMKSLQGYLFDMHDRYSLKLDLRFLPGSSWGCGSVTEEWDSLYAQKVQLLTFLSTLPESALSYGPSVETNMANSIEQREHKKSDIIVLDSDDDDESTGAHKQLTPENNKQLTPEKNKQLIPSEQAGALMRVVTEGIDEVDEIMHYRDQNSQIVPYIQVQL